MPKVTYTREQKAEAIAYARVEGWRAAGVRLGIDPRSVRLWSIDAGVSLEADPDQLQSAYDLALAKVTSDVASGRVKGSQLAVVLGILADKVRLRDKERPGGSRSGASTSAIAIRDTFNEWAIDAPLWPADADVDAIVDAIHYLHGELIRTANAESTNPGDDPSPHRRAILAWFSGRTEDRAGQPIDAPPDLLEWAQAITTALVTEHGDLLTWAAHDRAEDVRQAAERRAAFGALVVSPRLPDDLAALVAEADRLLEEMTG